MDRFQRAGAAFEQLCRTMARLRTDCPWDARQTLQSLKQYAVEEVYEVLEAIDADDPAAHAEELGDLLFQIVFQAEITATAPAPTTRFDVADVIGGIDTKLIRRHPHVFDRGDDDAGNPTSAQTARRSWEELKAEERPVDASRLAGIPRAMPALLRALRTGEKAASVGFDWPSLDGVRAKVDEESRELDEAIAADSAVAQREEVGDLLFALVNLCRHLRVDPEDALGAATDKFHRRFCAVEEDLRSRGQAMSETSLEELERHWQRAKARFAADLADASRSDDDRAGD